MAIEYLNPEDRYDIEVFNRNFKAVEDAVNHAELMQNTVWDSTQDGIISITAYDWDGELLGNFAFVKASDPETQAANAQKAIDAFVGSEPIQAKLTSHAGYDFLAWVKDDNSIPTSYGKYADLVNDIRELTINADDIADFGSMTESCVVRAAYTTNDNIVLGPTLSEREYSITVDRFERTYSSSSYFTVYATIRRENVPRMVMGVMVAEEFFAYGINATGDNYANIIMNTDLIKLRGSDVEQIKVTVSCYPATPATGKTPEENVSTVAAGAHRVQIYLRDSFQSPFSAYPSYQSSSSRGFCGPFSATFTSKQIRNSATAQTTALVNVYDNGTFSQYGTAASIYNDFCRFDSTNSWTSAFTAIIIRQLGIPPSKSSNAVRNASYSRWQELGKPNFSYPTFDFATLYYILSGEEYTNAETTNDGEI